MNLGDVKQIAYLSDDLETAMASWLRAGVGPFTWYRNLALNIDYQGQTNRVEMEVAIAYRGDQQIELIRQTNDVPSPYRVFFESGRLGLHHIAFCTRDIDQSLAAVRERGFEVIATMGNSAGRYAYFQAPEMPEVFYELLETNAEGEQFWLQCVDEARQWNGQDPIRVIDLTGV